MAGHSHFVADLQDIAGSCVLAVGDTIKSIPLIFGIDLFEAEPAGESTALMAALRDGFEASSGGHGALAALAFMVFVLLYTLCMALQQRQRARNSATNGYGCG